MSHLEINNCIQVIKAYVASHRLLLNIHGIPLVIAFVFSCIYPPKVQASSPGHRVENQFGITVSENELIVC